MRAEDIRDLRLSAEEAGIPIPGGYRPWGETAYENQGLYLHVIDWGVPASDAPAIVFLHGGAQTAHMWDFASLQLRHRYRVLALDQRGHGDSDWSEEGDYQPDAHVSDVLKLFEVFDLRKPVLCGLSMGGMNAAAFASRHSDLLSAVVLVDVAPEVSNEGGREIRDFIAGREDFESLDDVVDYAHAGNPLRPRHFLERSLRHNLRHLPGGRLTWKYDRRRFLSASDRAQVMRDVWSGVDNIACPALIVRGGVSRVLSQEAAERLASRIGGELVTVEGAGHIVAGDRPVEFARVLDDFCGRLLLAAR